MCFVISVMILLNQYLLSRALGPDGELPLSDKTARTIETNKFITHKPWRRYTACLRYHMGRSRQGSGREAGPGACAFIRVCGWSALVLGVRLGWSIQTKKSGILISFAGSYISGAQGEGPGSRRLFTQGCWGSHIRNSPGALWAVIQGMSLHERLVSV